MRTITLKQSSLAEQREVRKWNINYITNTLILSVEGSSYDLLENVKKTALAMGANSTRYKDSSRKCNICLVKE
jgi:hypothetical protein